MTKRLAFLFLFFSILHFTGISQDMNKIDLGGTWKFRRAGTKEWMNAKVPGVVQLDLFQNGKIPDPFYRDNESHQQWIGEIGWEYERSFFIPDSLFAHKNIDLVCKGLDTYANVFLNDSLIIVADNMFIAWYQPIKYKLRSGLNTIRIQFPSIIEENKRRYNKLKYKLPGDEKVVCRKAAYQFGWDWGPAMITTGIWQPIYIRYWDHVNVLGINYIQKSLTDSLALITARLAINSTLDDSALIILSTSGKEIARSVQMVKKGFNEINVNFEIRNPKRWWSNGLGEPYLYPFEHKVYFAGRLSGKGLTRIGLRTLELIQDPDSIGKSFYFKLNGIPIFIKGANYVPMDNILTRVKENNYRDLIKDAALAHMNMLRVWGGGIYEKDEFYDYCDQNGILVWQDFMFACAMYPGEKVFIDNIKSEAIQQVIRLRNHPCIALWCGNNEIAEGWKNWGWSEQYKYTIKDSTEIININNMIFDILLKNIIERYDSNTPYTPTSPMHGWGRAESLKEGDQHYWGVWHGKEPFRIYEKKVGRFVSEYGFQGFPDLVTINKFTLPDDRKIDSPVMKAHQKSPIGFERIEEYMLEDYKKPKNFVSYGYVSQLLQAEGMRKAIEAHRRAKPICMGTLYWQLNDCWPVISWSSIDYYGRKKAFYYWLNNEYAEQLVSPVIVNDKVQIYIISDDIKREAASLTIDLMDFSGSTFWNRTLSVDIPANGSIVAFDTSLLSITDGHKINEMLMLIQLKSETKVLSQNILYFDKPKNLVLAKPLIQKKVNEIPEGYTIELTSDKLVKNIFINLPFKGEFSDNYFDLIPGRPKTIIFRTKSRDQNIPDKIKLTHLAETY